MLDLCRDMASDRRDDERIRAAEISYKVVKLDATNEEATYMLANLMLMK